MPYNPHRHDTLPDFQDRPGQSASTAATPVAQTEESNPLPLGEGGTTDASLTRRVRAPGFDQTCDPRPLLLRLRAVALALRVRLRPDGLALRALRALRAGLSQRERRQAPPRPQSEERRARAHIDLGKGCVS